MSSHLFEVPERAWKAWEFAFLRVCCGMRHVGLFTGHFVLILRGMKEERPNERELRGASCTLQLGGKVPGDLCQCLPFFPPSLCLKRDHSDNTSSFYKWMRLPEPFELCLICLVALKKRNPPESGALLQCTGITADVKQGDGRCVTFSVPSSFL